MNDEDSLQQVFAWLKSRAGERGFTFLGRRVTGDMTFEDVLKTIPVGELETAASVGGALSLHAWKRVVPSAPPRLPERGGTQQMGIYKAASVFDIAQSTAAKGQPKQPEPPPRDDKISEYILDALLNTEAFQQNAERYVEDLNQPLLLRWLVGGVRAVDKVAESLSMSVINAFTDKFLKQAEKSSLESQIDAAFQNDMAAFQAKIKAKTEFKRETARQPRITGFRWYE